MDGAYMDQDFIDKLLTLRPFCSVDPLELYDTIKFLLDDEITFDCCDVQF